MAKFLFFLLGLVFGFSPAAAHSQYSSVSFVSWSPDGKMLAIGYGTTVRIVNVATMEELNSLDVADQRTEPVWSPDGSMLAIGDGTDVQIWNTPWNAASAQLVITYKNYADLHPPEPQGNVFSIAWRPDQTQIATGIDSVIDIWDVQTGERIYRLDNEGKVSDLAWNTNNLLASGGGNLEGAISLWNPDTGEAIKNLLVATRDDDSYLPVVYSLAWSPDNTNIVFGADDGRVRLWDTTQGEFWSRSYEEDAFTERHNQSGHAESVHSVAWSPDSHLIASAGRDSTIRIWDVASYKQIQIIQVLFQGFGGSFALNVAFSPDGTKLAYGTANGGLVIMDVPLLPAATPEATP